MHKGAECDKIAFMSAVNLEWENPNGTKPPYTEKKPPWPIGES